MTRIRKRSSWWGSLLVAALGGFLVAHLSESPQTRAQSGHSRGLAQRVAALEQEVAELKKCCRRLNALEILVEGLAIRLEECCPTTPNCDDGNPCTDDYFDPDLGHCVHVPVAEGTPCPDGECIAGECIPIFIDRDGDGYPVGEDCDDSDPTVYPGATERRDGKDNDCDGEVDEETRR